MVPIVPAAIAAAAGLTVRRAPQSCELRQEGGRLLAGKHEAEEVAQLACQDDDGDAGREPDDDGMRDVLDVGPKPQEAEDEKRDARDHRREEKAVIAVPLDRRRDEDDEGAGRSADLEPAAAERRDQEAADDRRVEPALGRGSGRDGDRHRQRQRHDRDGEPRQGVGPELAEVVAFPEDGDELRREQLAKAGLGRREAGRSDHLDSRGGSAGVKSRGTAIAERPAGSMIVPIDRREQ